MPPSTSERVATGTLWQQRNTGRHNVTTTACTQQKYSIVEVELMKIGARRPPIAQPRNADCTATPDAKDCSQPGGNHRAGTSAKPVKITPVPGPSATLDTMAKTKLCCWTAKHRIHAAAIVATNPTSEVVQFRVLMKAITQRNDGTEAYNAAE
mmetsp:Transcript_52979/g.154191  ORF Transcript_52979/g.154191 Transcript_52979/m.154191 type:complete len:153 (+) Transcript_52979:749-1207(+)